MKDRRRFLSVCLMMALVCFACVTGFTSVTSAQGVPDGYMKVCENGYCKLIKVDRAFATPAPEPGGTVFFRTVSFTSTKDAEQNPTKTVSYANRSGGYEACRCASTGVCQCVLGQCTCPACERRSTGQRQVYATTVYTAAPPTLAATYASGGVGKWKDDFGNTYVTSAGGRYNNKIARWVARGVSLGVD